jgi:thermitase
VFFKNQGRSSGFARAAIATVGVVVGLTSTASAQERIPGEYLVKYKSTMLKAMGSLSRNANVEIQDHHQPGRLMKISMNQKVRGMSQEAAVIAAILRDPNVEYVVPNFKLHAALHSAVESDASVDSATNLLEQYANKKARVEEAWAKAGNRGSKNVKVAVIDTGVDYRHQALSSNMVPGYDFRNNDKDPMDETSAQNPGHGTHCAGSIGGNGLVNGGIVGANAEVSLMPLRFLGADGSGDLNSAIKAIDYAIQQGAQVVSNSWGATVPRAQAAPLIEAVKRANDAGAIMVMAAANDGRNNDRTEVFPTNAQFDHTISVSASGPNDEKPSWSNYGRATVHIAAPGLDIMSTIPNNKYMKMSGTSMATPLISGVVAFLKAQDPSLTGAQIRALMQITGAKTQIEVACNCRVDMEAATDVILAKQLFITPAAGTVGIGGELQFSGTYGQGALTYAVADTSIAEIDATGKFVAKAEGQTTVTVKDSTGATSTSLPIYVGAASSGPDQPGGGECPLGDPLFCQIICGIAPELPFCSGDGGGGLPELPF